MEQALERLIRRARQGDQEAFALLVGQYKDKVFRYAYGMLSDRMEAEDVAQEAFLKAYTSLAKLQQVYAFSSWLTQIASRLCYDRLQKRKREQPTDDDRLERIGGSEKGDPDLYLDIRQAMRALSPQHREAILLRDVEGYSYEEIAAMLEIPLGTVKSRIRNARLLLRQAIKLETEENHGEAYRG
ncbi:sigma-24 [Paenibacillus sp. J31TS4]|uniref:RNA polymerase sigma factor n=1 Tax=Paenibacillus sp. J31TS4 TaxID=2807195 RepID=UPI001B2F60B8|nr:sigma-70 family RNA polymerase sigma factor [Paenibacillus sp. J31TS4]GIP37113.1 sigma-24 [Paenibacillus sp. J31TS4]